MADATNIDPSALPFELPEPAAAASPTSKELPKDLYYQKTALCKALETDPAGVDDMLKGYLKDDVYTEINRLANGRNVDPLTVMRGCLYESFQNGGFDCTQPRGDEDPKEVKRTGNDEQSSFIDNIRLKALIGETNFGILQANARPNKLSNVAALNRGIRFAIAAGTL